MFVMAAAWALATLPVNHPPQPATASPAASSRISIPIENEIYHSAGRGELQKVTKWLRKGGLVDALYSGPTDDGRTATSTLLHAVATYGHLECYDDCGDDCDLGCTCALANL